MTGTADTLPKLLCERARSTPSAPAFREKAFGIWETHSWSDVRARVEAVALGFAALGVERDDKLAIVGDNRPDWVHAELAAQAIGAVPVGVYQDSVADELATLVSAADAKLIVVEDQEQVDKVLDVRDRLLGVERVVYADERGMRGYDDPFLISLAAVCELGRGGELEAHVACTRPEDIALLATTSGTTGRPKLAMLTHENLLSMAKNLLAVDPLAAGDELVSFLPLAWVGEQMTAVSAALLAGLTVNFPEEPETVSEDLREIAPSVMFAPPRIWESLLSEVQMQREDASWLKRQVLDWALARSAADKPAECLCLYWIRDALGLRRLKRAYTGGAALGPDTIRFFRDLGVNLKQIYGQTEVSGISVVHRDGAVKPDTMGEPIPETDLRITDAGEIVIKSPAVFLGYYKDPEATAAVLEDGWLHSGDAGYLDEDGHLVVIDRASDVTRLDDGTPFSPQFVENKLKFSPYVREAVVFGGNGKPFVSALIVIDFPNVSTWAEKRQIPFTTYTDLSQRDAVRALVGAEIERVQATMPSAMQVRRFLLLHKELDADDAELTRTRKVRRHTVAERYRALVEALDGGADTVSVTSEITYQDGRRASLEVDVPVVTLP